ncbi:SLC13 family permease [Catellatospora citrea]|uniref:SLC13 family permease n=1 Tax=Catellatospora citrea TaxID=53366 RepID=A0A8J3KGL2_9ACTN|nr:SLC13 family permease [Catellatospora citrea]RKE07792.1 citrate transporter [Catellatospora citrea]GIF99382.1 SLC13 family permease [Catellatospora citrea]
MSQAALAFAILGAVVVLFAWNRLPVEVVALGAALSLYFTGLLGPAEIFAGFGDPVVIFVASLFVVSEGLDATGVTTWAGQTLMAHAGTGRTRLLVLVMLLVAGLTALITVNGAVAALLPMVVILAVRTGHAPSELAMPLAFGAHAGSMLALTGTPINVIASEAAQEASGRGFGYFEFAMAGVPLVVGVITIAVLAGHRLLPRRTAGTMPRDLSRHARTLAKQYRLDRDAHRLLVPPPAATGPDTVPGSAGTGPGPRAGGGRATAVAPPDPERYPGLVLLGVQSADGVPRVGGPAGPGDVLVLSGDADTAARFAAEHALEILPGAAAEHVAGALLNREFGVAEVVVSPRSGLVGATAFPGMVTDSGDLVVLAVQRKGHHQGPGRTALAAGDTLLVQGDWAALERNVDRDPDVLVVDSPALVRRQAVPLGPGAYRAVAVLAAMVLLLATGIVPAAVAGVLAAGAMVVLRVVTVAQAYRAVSWTTIVIIGAMIPLSVAIQRSGAAGLVAHALVAAVGDAGPYALLLGLFLVTAVLGQLISNTATALIVIPIALSAAAELGVSVRPVIMCVTVAAAAAFLTPVATPANMMVLGPGGYRFGDYWRLGSVMLAWFGVVAVLLVPLFWRF